MTADTPANPGSGLGTADQRLLTRLFQHPLSHNLRWRDVIALFRSLGALEQTQGGDVLLRLNGQHQTFKPSHDKDLEPEDIMALRHFLTRAGWAEGTLVAAAATASTDMIVVIDHANARIYAATLDDAAAPRQLHHVQSTTDRARRDADREETWPTDTHYFAQIAAALEGEGRIVVMGHGTGQSNEADHLIAYLAAHHGAVHARIVREVKADLSHQTLRQLLATARQALHPTLRSAGRNAG